MNCFARLVFWALGIHSESFCVIDAFKDEERPSKDTSKKDS